MTHSADPDQLANWSGSGLFCKGKVYPGSAGPGLNQEKIFEISAQLPYSI